MARRPETGPPIRQIAAALTIRNAGQGAVTKVMSGAKYSAESTDGTHDPRGDAGARRIAREAEWAAWMRAGLDGDTAAYRQLLETVTPFLRGIACGGLARAGLGDGDVEDVVQEVLLAIHLKRQTWIRDQPFLPWLNAIARYKLIDVMRRRGRRGEVPIDGFLEVLAEPNEPAEVSHRELSRLVGRLKGRELSVVRAVSLEGKDIRETAAALNMKEGAVRVALHRGLKRLADIYHDVET